MNIITKIAISVLLIASVAQSTQTASYVDHAKKTSKIICYVAQMIAGSYLLAEYLAVDDPRRQALRNDQHRLDLIFCKNPCARILSDCIKHSQACVIAGPALLYYGIKGLKQEICPQFNPIAWMKNKLCKKAEQSA